MVTVASAREAIKTFDYYFYTMHFSFCISYLSYTFFPLPVSFHLPPFLLTLLPSLHLSPTPRLCKAYKSHGDRLAPLGMSQPEALSKGSSPDMAPLCSETTSRGDIYMKGTDPSNPGLKEGKKGLYSRKQSKDNKRLQ